MSSNRTHLGLYIYGSLMSTVLTLVGLYLAVTSHGSFVTPLSLAPLALYFGYRTRRIYTRTPHQPLRYSYSLPLTITLYIIALGATLVRGYATLVQAGAPLP